MAKRTNESGIDQLHSYGLHIPTRTIVLETTLAEDGDADGVNYAMVLKFLKNMLLLESVSSSDPITIILNTEGGDVACGMAIYDRIRESKCHITVKVYGCAQSMGAIIMQAADERILKPHSRVMFHLGQGATVGGNPYEILASAQHEVTTGEQIDNILYERIKAKYDAEGKTFTKARFRELTFKGRYMTAREAVDMGLADRIEYPKS